MNAKEKTIALMSSTSVSFNAATQIDLYTVPTGKTFVPAFVVLRSPSASLAAGTCTFGKSGALTSFLNTQTLTNLNGTTKAITCMPVPNATPVGFTPYTAAEIFQIDITGTVAGESCTADTYGYLF